MERTDSLVYPMTERYRRKTLISGDEPRSRDLGEARGAEITPSGSLVAASGSGGRKTLVTAHRSKEKPRLGGAF